MQVVGTLYILMGVGFIPAINEARLDLAFPYAAGYE